MQYTSNLFFVFFFENRVEIIRLSDKSFKETIKDVELSSYRSTTKEGYVSLDPSKPLPHEFEEGKLSRYNDNLRQKYLTNVGIEAGGEQPIEAANEHEAKIVSQYANANDSVILNKTEFREILMNALNIKNVSTSDLPKSKSINGKSSKVPISDGNRFKSVRRPEIKAYSENITPPTMTTTTTDDVIYLNQTIEKSSSPMTTASDAQKKANSISLDTPEVDKLLNEGKFYKWFVIIHELCIDSSVTTVPDSYLFQYTFRRFFEKYKRSCNKFLNLF